MWVVSLAVAVPAFGSKILSLQRQGFSLQVTSIMVQLYAVAEGATATTATKGTKERGRAARYLNSESGRNGQCRCVCPPRLRSACASM